LAMTKEHRGETPRADLPRDAAATFLGNKKPASFVGMPVGWMGDFVATKVSPLLIPQRRGAGRRAQRLFGRGARRGGTFSRGLFRRLQGTWRCFTMAETPPGSRDLPVPPPWR
jgi:hypothetical protein